LSALLSVCSEEEGVRQVEIETDSASAFEIIAIMDEERR
jgi:hypothetical protein